MANGSGDRHKNASFLLEWDGRKVILSFTQGDRAMLFWTASDALHGASELEGME